MSEFPPALPHRSIEQVFPDVFFVTGTMRGEFFGSTWQFSRNMTIVREQGRLSLINAVRLDEAGLASLDALGRVNNVIRLGAMHGYDDPFYVDRYPAKYWAIKGAPDDKGLTVDQVLTSGGEMPFADCSLFELTTSKLPEGMLRLDREGGILIACDALQNWVEPDELFLEETVATMRDMGFFTPANLGPAWMQLAEPKAEDFARLMQIPFKHVLCGHGSPLRDTAKEAFQETFKRIFAL